MKLCIFASDLAIITGHNKFKNVTEILHKIWSKNFQDDYQNTLKLISDSNMDLRQDETDLECINRISKNNNLDINLTKCLKSNNLEELDTNKQDILTKCKNLNKEQKKLVNDALLNVANTNFGTVHENYAVNKYSNLLNTKVLKVSKFFKRNICNYKNTEWIIGGKIDGLRDDNIIVEVKNRVNKLFLKLRDYEKVQIFAYLYILEFEKAHLIEFLNKNNDPKINILEVIYNHDYWEIEILSKIYKFIKFFHKFIESDKMKIMLLTDNVDTLDSYMNKYIHN